MEFQDGDLVQIHFSAKAAFIENGIFQMASEPSEQKLLAIIVPGNGLSKDCETVEVVPVANCSVPVDKINSTLLQLIDPYFEKGLSVECGLIRTFPKASIEKMNHSISDSNLDQIKKSVQRFLEGKV